MAFIDLPNITSGGYSYGIRRLKFGELANVLLDGARNVGCNVYVVNKGKRQELFAQIQRCGLRLETVTPGKSVDGRLIFDMLMGAYENDYDIAVLASGDKDYIPVIQEVKRHKKDVWIASFKNSIGKAMIDAADKFINLDECIDKISMPPKKFKTICSDCGKECEVPFKPFNGRPVYCNDCYKKRKTV